MTTDGVVVYLSANALTLASPDRLRGGTTYIVGSKARSNLNQSLLGRKVKVTLSGFMQVEQIEVLP